MKQLLFTKEMYHSLLDLTILEFHVGKHILIQEGTTNIQPQQHNDYHIMDDFTSAGFKLEELYKLIRFQIHLKATCLSDISIGEELVISSCSCKVKLDLTKYPYL